MRQVQATVYPRVESNTNGIPAITYPTSAGTVMGVKLPTGGTIVQKIYGLDYVGEFEFYTKQRNAALLEGNRLKISDKWYDIKGTRDFVKAITCLLSEVPNDGA